MQNPGEPWSRLFAWIESELGGCVVDYERQERWRPAFFVDFEREGESLPLYMDGRCLLYPERFFEEYLLLATKRTSTMGKELLEVFCDGDAYVVDDFKSLTRASDGRVIWQSDVVDKGHFEELSKFGDSIAKGEESPIPFADLIDTSAVALEVEDAIFGRSGLDR